MESLDTKSEILQDLLLEELDKAVDYEDTTTPWDLMVPPLTIITLEDDISRAPFPERDAMVC